MSAARPIAAHARDPHPGAGLSSAGVTRGSRAALALAALAASALAVLTPAAARAQEATNTPAATQPAVGGFYLRQKVQYLRLERDPSPADRTIDEVVATTSISYGLLPNVGLTLSLPVVYASSRERSDSGRDVTRQSAGLYDPSLSAKISIIREGLGPVDTVRLSAIVGLEFPSGDGRFSSRGFDPFLGAVFTGIFGRHGINQSIQYKFNTRGRPFFARAGDGPDDALFFDTAYLFRLSPDAYAPDTTASLYTTLELNGLYETNGDTELLLGPGLLYEAREFALEATVGLPIVRDVSNRPRTGLVVTLGFRVLF